jgi:hypothetical protein
MEIHLVHNPPCQAYFSAMERDEVLVFQYTPSGRG